MKRKRQYSTKKTGLQFRRMACKINMREGGREMILNNKYVKWGLTAFCTVGALLLFSDTLFGSKTLIAFVKHFLRAMQPILYGAAMAYLLAPAINFFDGFAGRVLQGPGTKGRKVSLGARSVSIFLTWMIVVVVLYLIGSVLAPELYKSILQLIANVETYYNTILGWIHRLLEMNPTLENWALMRVDTYYDALENWFTRDLLPQATEVLTRISGGVFEILGMLGDLLVGVIVSVYFLASKEGCAAYCRKLMSGIFSGRCVYWITRGLRKMDVVFAGFVRGKLLDSLIIGILCFIGCTLLEFPYTPLVSVVVGVTNVIPFFGPFLGAIPCSFLILLANPIKGLYFILFVLGLQQLDGNIIGPKILGDKTGLSSLWVIFAILVGGSFFGVAGMFFGVPVCACAYSLVNLFVESRLMRKNKPVETEAYYDGDSLSGEPSAPSDQR